MIRLYLEQSELSLGARLALSANHLHYLMNVMRKAEGDELLVFNEVGGEWRVRLEALSRKRGEFVCLECTRPPKPTLGPVLLIALIKRARLESIIEKATELGVSKVQLVKTRRSLGEHTNMDRLRAIAIEAAEQTERLDVPEVLTAMSLDQLLTQDWPHLVFCDEDLARHEGVEKNSSLLPLEAIKSASGLGVVIGPEGGFDDNERQLLRTHPQAIGLRLGPRILRADTAAFAALSLIQSHCGDWNM